MAATRHSALARCGRHLPRLYHHEHRGFHSSPISIVRQQQPQRGFSSSRSLASPVLLSNTNIQDIRADLLERPEQLTFDTLSPTPSFLLDVSLADYLGVYPWSSAAVSAGTEEEDDAAGAPADPYATLKQGYHLIHFPLALPPSRLCPDGTDPYHSPGLGWDQVFARRMWAGGRIEFDHQRPLRLQPQLPGERILDVDVRGPPGEEKLFVNVLREYDWARPRLSFNHKTMENELAPTKASLEGRKGSVVEVRTLVFLRKEEEQKVHARSESSIDTAKLIKVPFEPTFKLSLVPDRTLLFHFSALSYNAHLIHLDERYSQDVEGRPGLLVHGPLCLILMLKVLRRSHRERQAKKKEANNNNSNNKEKTKKSSSDEENEELLVSKIEYRNLAPLYVGDRMTVCVRSPNGTGHAQRHDVWIENQHGGLCVKGTVVTV
ncbi:uncharacterized protein PG998_000229 [Apiospora kogelbergensis]|uniref:uncharacterized protein n=1 Tax=Apiospora kogelbergensis TaxID=1337665 RepID=UPI00312FD374